MPMALPLGVVAKKFSGARFGGVFLIPFDLNDEVEVRGLPPFSISSVLS